MQNSSPAAEPVIISREGDVLGFTLNNAQAGNEVTGRMFELMLQALAEHADGKGARVLRIRAQGAAFCTGRERGGRDAVSIRAEVVRLIALKQAVRSSPLISIAEVQGDAFGFGLGLAMLCDFTLVARGARLAFPEMRKGLPPAAIMAYLGHYGLPKACFPLVLFGDDFSPDQARDAGLISEVCEPAQLSSRAAALTDRILSLNAESARQCKAFFQMAESQPIERNFQLATDTLTVTSLRLMAAAR